MYTARPHCPHKTFNIQQYSTGYFLSGNFPRNTPFFKAPAGNFGKGLQHRLIIPAGEHQPEWTEELTRNGLAILKLFDKWFTHYQVNSMMMMMVMMMIHYHIHYH